MKQHNARQSIAIDGIGAAALGKGEGRLGGAIWAKPHKRVRTVVKGRRYSTHILCDVSNLLKQVCSEHSRKEKRRVRMGQVQRTLGHADGFGLKSRGHRESWRRRFRDAWLGTDGPWTKIRTHVDFFFEHHTSPSPPSPSMTKLQSAFKKDKARKKSRTLRYALYFN